MLPIRRRSFLRSSAILATASVLHKLPAYAGEEPSFNWSMVPGILREIRIPEFQKNDLSVIGYGADPAGLRDSHAAFKAAIEACNRGRGGRVVVPAGTYLLNGPIRLLSDVNLHLEAGALVRFGINPADYLPLVEVRWQGIRCYNYSPLIYAYGEENIAVTGQGTFDGQASEFFGGWGNLQNPDWIQLQQFAMDRVPVKERLFGTGHYLRPTMLEPYQCTNVWIDGVTFKGSPFWTMHPTFCQNVVISNVTVLPGVTNDDGCDPDSCKNVLIDSCNFSTVDDSISIKAGFAPDSDFLPGTENVLVFNCSTLQSSFGGFTIGTNVSAGIRNVFVDNYTAANGTNAFYIKGNMNAAGFIENVEIRNSKALQVHHLLAITPGVEGTAAEPLHVPRFGPIRVENVTCQDAISIGFLFEGLEQNPIEGITLIDVTIDSSPKLISSTYTSVQSKGLIFENQPVTIDESA
jgi:polygalacturonase